MRDWWGGDYRLKLVVMNQYFFYGLISVQYWGRFGARGFVPWLFLIKFCVKNKEKT